MPLVVSEFFLAINNNENTENKKNYKKDELEYLAIILAVIILVIPIRAVTLIMPFEDIFSSAANR